jgi:hypothetical protein
MFLEGLRKGMAAPDEGWLPFVKIMFGFFLLVVLAGLSAIIALGHVKAESSFGLDIILGGLLTLSGGFAGWAFRDAPRRGASVETEQTEQTGEGIPHADSK